MNFLIKKIASLVVLLILSACAVGPDYKVTEQITGEQYKAIEKGQWIKASPADDLGKGNWWTRYNDSELNSLMTQLNDNNFNIAKAYAQYQAALAQTKQNRSRLFPTLGADSEINRRGGSEQDTSSNYSLGANLRWEADLWGKIRREVESRSAAAQASAADLENTRLSMQAQLAKNYFALRLLDNQKQLLEQIVKAYERSVKTNQNRYQQGVAPRADVVAAEAQLANAKTDRLSVESDRQALENSIAVLLGLPPADFTLQEESQYVMHWPDIPVGLPSELLQRRPDIASAERHVAEANAQIGVAQAAWFPNLTLSMNTSLQANHFSDWINAPISLWSLGPALVLDLFDAGARSAQVEYAKANFEAQVANYRQTVLEALKEVDDAINQLASLQQEYALQEEAVSANRQSLRITTNQYQAGLIDYLNVIQVQNTTYNAEIRALQLQGQRLEASVQLILSLGGGWSAADMAY